VLNILAFDGVGRVHVDIHANVTPRCWRKITARGGLVEFGVPRTTMRFGRWIPLANAEALAGRSEVISIRNADHVGSWLHNHRHRAGGQKHRPLNGVRISGGS